MYQLGVQLYTVIDKLNSPEGIRKTLTAIKEMGYETAQLCGSFDEICAFAAGCHEVGLAIVGILSDLDTCEQFEQQLFALCKKYEIKDIGVSSATKEYEAAMAYISRANAFAKCADREGFTFSYHNHGHEFIKTSCGKTVMELFEEGFAPEVDFMPDTYWIQDGGADICHFLELVNGRVKILHLKDMKRTKTGHTFTEIGSGNLYFPGIVETAKEIGVQHFIVEQDSCDGDPLDSLRQSITYLKTNDLL